MREKREGMAWYAMVCHEALAEGTVQVKSTPHPGAWMAAMDQGGHRSHQPADCPPHPDLHFTHCNQCKFDIPGWPRTLIRKVEGNQHQHVLRPLPLDALCLYRMFVSIHAGLDLVSALHSKLARH